MEGFLCLQGGAEAGSFRNLDEVIKKRVGRLAKKLGAGDVIESARPPASPEINYYSTLKIGFANFPLPFI